MSIFTSYSFLLIATATFVLASAAGAIGTVSVLKGQALIGDAIGHATYPGIVLAFMLTLSKDVLVLSLGATVAGCLVYMIIQVLNKYTKLSLDSILSISLSSFFGIGMVLKSLVSGNSNYAGASQAGLGNYIFGQTSYIREQDVWVIIIASSIALLLLILFHKEIKLFVFDEEYATVIGLKRQYIQTVVMLMTMVLISVGLKLVGAIMIASLLIIPAIIALQWSQAFHRVLIIAGLAGGISAVIGTYFSTTYNGMSTGPTIIIILTMVAFISLLIGPHGIISRKRQLKKEACD